MNENELVDQLTNTVMDIIRREFTLYDGEEVPYSQDDALYGEVHAAIRETYKENTKNVS